jgi:hypothetical protein
LFSLACPGAANGSLRRAILTPGYQLPLLRSWRILVIDQNVRANQDVIQQENSGTNRIPKTDAL